MNDEKVKYLIDMIKDMDIENRLRLAICMNDNYSHTNLEYNKKEMYRQFDFSVKRNKYRIQNYFSELCKLSSYNVCNGKDYGIGFV